MTVKAKSSIDIITPQKAGKQEKDMQILKKDKQTRREKEIRRYHLAKMQSIAGDIMPEKKQKKCKSLNRS